jgi:hypothetical protein
MAKSELIYITKGDQLSFYMVGGKRVDGGLIASGTLLYLRNRACHLHENKPNVFEIASMDDEDRYLFLDAHQVEYVSGNIGENAND